MSLIETIVGIFIFLLFVIMAILGCRALDKEEKAIKDFIGRNHASLVTSHTVGGDYHFDEMNDEEKILIQRNLQISKLLVNSGFMIKLKNIESQIIVKLHMYYPQ